jgi:heterodisulfide reductase subunit C
MDHSPREMLALFRAGAIETLLRSRSIWLCASCYQCTVRCPAGIRITDLLYALKRTAMEKGVLPKRYPVYVLSEIFTSMVRRYGRNHEASLLVRYYLRTRPSRLLSGLGEGFALWSHGRLPARARRIRRIDGLRRIIAKAETFDRPQEQLPGAVSPDLVGYSAIGMEAPREKGMEAA